MKLGNLVGLDEAWDMGRGLIDWVLRRIRFIGRLILRLVDRLTEIRTIRSPANGENV